MSDDDTIYTKFLNFDVQIKNDILSKDVSFSHLFADTDQSYEERKKVMVLNDSQLIQGYDDTVYKFDTTIVIRKV